MRTLRYLSIVLVTMLMVSSSCKNEDEDNKTQYEPPLITAGQIITSEFSKDDVVIERMVDTVVNFGSLEAPALFFLNSEHTLNGEPIEVGNRHGNVFRSLKRSELENFIVIWGRLNGIEIDLSDQSAEALDRKQLAYYKLQGFLIGNNIDLPVLVAIAQDTVELGSAVRIVRAANASGNLKDERIFVNNPEVLLRSLEKYKIKPSDFSKALRDQGMTEESFLALSNAKGVDLGQAFREEASTKQIGILIVAGVVWATKFLSKITIRLIENYGPVVDIDNDFSSYLHDSDLVVTHYIADPVPDISPTYSVAYGSLAKCSFLMETYYKGKHSTWPGTFIPRVGMIVESVKCSWGMHVTGDITYDIGYTDGTEENPIAYSGGTIYVGYGDCCCFKRIAELDYEVRGDTGYKETMWDIDVDTTNARMYNR
jgi:hypothetical protein